jgi:septum formation protein
METVRYNIILASNSPRRKELLAGLDVDFEVRVLQGIDESYPAELPTQDIAGYISQKKAAAYRGTMGSDELVITADTIVVLDGEVMGKPADEEDACRMLRKLSGRTHQVITGVTLTTKERQQSFSVETDVAFKELTDAEIDYYVQHYKPMDKAGAYGIQEWIGHIGVTSISGSYFNVMGLPVQRIYEALKGF